MTSAAPDSYSPVCGCASLLVFVSVHFCSRLFLGLSEILTPLSMSLEEVLYIVSRMNELIKVSCVSLETCPLTVQLFISIFISE